jgi:hypothetical protein
MNKTLTAIRKNLRGTELEPGEQRRLDAFMLEVRAVGSCVCIVAMFIGYLLGS